MRLIFSKLDLSTRIKAEPASTLTVLPFTVPRLLTPAEVLFAIIVHSLGSLSPLRVTSFSSVEELNIRATCDHSDLSFFSVFVRVYATKPSLLFSANTILSHAPVVASLNGEKAFLISISPL